MADKIEMISIPQKEYDQLVSDQRWLAALEAAGIDNWDGCDIAREAMSEYGN